MTSEQRTSARTGRDPDAKASPRVPAPADPPPTGPSRTGPHPVSDRLTRAARRVRAADVRRPWVWDGTLTGLWAGAALIDVGSGGWQRIPGNVDTVPIWLVLAMSLGLTLPLAIRRRHPLRALLLMLPFLFLNAWTGARLQAGLLQMIVVYGIALRLPLRTLTGVLCLVSAPVALDATRHPVGSWDQTFVPTFYFFVLVALLGFAVRSRQEYTASLVERARRLEVEHDQQIRLAAAAERTRIAREMHDIIGHNLSVITGLADGGRYAAAKSPERAAQALGAISDTSRTALAELRRLLDVLRDDSPGTPAGDRAPQPALADLDDLVTGVRAAGLPVRLTTDGPASSLPAGRQLTVYRVVQEALTNTLKHTPPGTTASVALARTPRDLTVTVTDTGPAGPSAPAAEGRGITGMRERAALYDGTLESGPLPGGGWQVRLRLPVPTAEEALR
ncbi:sensor histidine kinase [Streptomyces sp. NPDC006798]|uniref:sensor histidine kinase n=1 Tax=Streptomyces sp. NPDC006798 TaxID=3155462 RepID=UPI0033C6CB7D